MLLICPFLLVISGSMTVLVTSQSGFSPRNFFLGPIAPESFICSFSALRRHVDFVHVHLYFYAEHDGELARALSAIIGGTVYQVVQWIYIIFRWALPNTARFTEVSPRCVVSRLVADELLIVLFGAEISFAEQNIGRMNSSRTV